MCQEVFLTLLGEPLPQGRSAPGWARWRSTAAGICSPPPGAGGGRNDDTALERLTFETPEGGRPVCRPGGAVPDSRALLHLRYYEGFTVAELARQFRTTAPALSARLYRAKQQLRKKLEELGYESSIRGLLSKSWPRPAPLNRVEEQRRALASRCSHTESEVTAMTTKPRRPIRILVAAAAVAAALTAGALAASGALGSIRCSPAERLHQPTA